MKAWFPLTRRLSISCEVYQSCNMPSSDTIDCIHSHHRSLNLEATNIVKLQDAFARRLSALSHFLKNLEPKMCSTVHYENLKLKTVQIRFCMKDHRIEARPAYQNWLARNTLMFTISTMAPYGVWLPWKSGTKQNKDQEFLSNLKWNGIYHCDSKHTPIEECNYILNLKDHKRLPGDDKIRSLNSNRGSLSNSQSIQFSRETIMFLVSAAVPWSLYVTVVEHE